MTVDTRFLLLALVVGFCAHAVVVAAAFPW